jgi:D-alanyl-D-alanine carboxypeptidase/D-alanyl-D-alanine-endopeptidase (penicillin-binding protein 4)
VLVSLLVAVLVGAPANASASQAPLATRLAQALAVPNVNHSRSAALALELESGRIVFERNRVLPLVPASTEKLGVSFASLKAFGPAYRIETQVVGDGGLEDGVWHGDLVLKGHGDPTLSVVGLRRLAAAVRAIGIRRVTGAVVGDESFFDTQRTAPGWKASFYILESPPLSALTVDRGEYRGRISENPPLAAASLFRAALERAGVRVAARSRTGLANGEEVVLAQLASPPLLAILREVNRESDNFTAEILLKHLGATRGAAGTTAAGADVVRRALEAAGVMLSGVRIVDGSGLSLLDRMTAETLVDILAAAWQDPLLRGSFMESLAVAGRSGTLETRLTDGPATGRVFAKTGTTALSSALAGYVSNRFVFAIVQNGPPLAPDFARRAQDRFVNVLAVQ